jgi:hypothetical protein
MESKNTKNHLLEDCYKVINQYKSCILQGRAPEKPSDNLALLKIAMDLSLI